MTSSDLWDADAARRYDDASSPMFSPEILGPTGFGSETTARRHDVCEVAGVPAGG